MFIKVEFKKECIGFYSDPTEDSPEDCAHFKLGKCSFFVTSETGEQADCDDVIWEEV